MNHPPPTVPQHIHDAVMEAQDEDFATSFLWGATVTDMKLLPRTTIAYDRLTMHEKVRAALTRLGMTLLKPAPWGAKSGSQLSWREAWPDLDEPGARPRRRPNYDRW